MLQITDSFTPSKLRDYLILYLNNHIGTIIFPDGTSDLAITIGNEQTNDVKIDGIEINIPLFPNSEEISLVDAHTASYCHYWEIHVFLWEDSDEGRLKLYEVLHTMLRMLSGVKIYCCPGGISRGFDYSEHFTVTFTQTCTGDKIRLE